MVLFQTPVWSRHYGHVNEKTFPLSAYLEKNNPQKNTISSMVLFQTPVWSRHYGHVNTYMVLFQTPVWSRHYGHVNEKTFPLSAYLEKNNPQKNTISSMVLFQTPVWSRHYGHVNEKTFPLSAYLEKNNPQKNTISSMVLFQTPVWSRHYGHVIPLDCFWLAAWLQRRRIFLAGLLFSLYGHLQRIVYASCHPLIVCVCGSLVAETGRCTGSVQTDTGGDVTVVC